MLTLLGFLLVGRPIRQPAFGDEQSPPQSREDAARRLIIRGEDATDLR